MLDTAAYSPSEYFTVAAVIRGDSFVVSEMMRLVKQDDFFSPHLGIAFKVACDLRSQNLPTDRATLCEHLSVAFKNDSKLSDASAPLQAERVATDVGKITAASNATGAIYHAKRMVSAAQIRRVIDNQEEISQKLQAFEFTNDPDLGADSLIAMVQSGAMSLSAAIAKERRESRLTELLDAHYHELVAQYEKPPHEIAGYKTGFPTMDRRTDGLCPGDFILVGGETGGGKTAFAMELARNSARLSRASWHVFSYEMGHTKLINRWVFAEAKVDKNRYRDKTLTDSEWDRLRAAYRRLAELPSQFMHTDPTLKLSDIAMICRQAKHRGECGGILVDYLQLMPEEVGRSEARRDQALGYIAQSLKNLAGELQVPVIGLTQLNDNGLVREGRSILHAADMFMVPEMEGEDTDEFRRCKISFKKMRDQARSHVNLLFWGAQTRFGEEDEHYGNF